MHILYTFKNKHSSMKIKTRSLYVTCRVNNCKFNLRFNLKLGPHNRDVIRDLVL